jgi:hypothetical protein
MGGRLDGIGDKFGSVDARFETVNGRFGEVGTKLNGLGEQVSGVGGRVDAVNASVGDVSGRVDAVGGRVDAVGGRVDAVTKGLEPLADELRSRPGPAEVEDSITKIVDAAQTDVAARLGSLEETVLTLAEALLRPPNRPGPVPSPRGEGTRI